MPSQNVDCFLKLNYHRQHHLKLCVMAQFNPLSPNTDQHQFSPNDIHTKARDKVMRIDKMITSEKML